MGTERARLGYFRGFNTDCGRLGTFRGLCTERARLGTFRGFGTQRARLGTLIQMFEIFTQNEQKPGQRFFFKVLDENQKIVLNIGILKNKISTPNFTKLLNP